MVDKLATLALTLVSRILVRSYDLLSIGFDDLFVASEDETIAKCGEGDCHGERVNVAHVYEAVRVLLEGGVDSISETKPFIGLHLIRKPKGNVYVGRLTYVPLGV